MSCAVCGANTRRGRPPIDEPKSLAGLEACDWCGQRIGQLVRGQLSKAGFDELMTYAVKLDDAQVAAELHVLWESPGGAKGEADAKAKAEASEAQATLNAALEAMPVTSGHDFAGFRIMRYLGFSSAEVVLGMGLFRGFTADFADVFGTEAQGLGRKLQEAKSVAFGRLRNDVWGLGGNAIIGIDLDYTMFGSSLVGVIASGTAVFIEPHD